MTEIKKPFIILSSIDAIDKYLKDNPILFNKHINNIKSKIITLLENDDLDDIKALNIQINNILQYSEFNSTTASYIDNTTLDDITYIIDNVDYIQKKVHNLFNNKTINDLLYAVYIDDLSLFQNNLDVNNLQFNVVSNIKINFWIHLAVKFDRINFVKIYFECFIRKYDTLNKMFSNPDPLSTYWINMTNRQNSKNLTAKYVIHGNKTIDYIEMMSFNFFYKLRCLHSNLKRQPACRIILDISYSYFSYKQLIDEQKQAGNLA